MINTCSTQVLRKHNSFDILLLTVSLYFANILWDKPFQTEFTKPMDNFGLSLYFELRSATRTFCGCKTHSCNSKSVWRTEFQKYFLAGAHNTVTFSLTNNHVILLQVLTRRQNTACERVVNQVSYARLESLGNAAT